MNDKTSADYDPVKDWVAGFLDAHDLTSTSLYRASSSQAGWNNRYYCGYQLVEILSEGGECDSSACSMIFAIVPIGEFSPVDEHGRVANAMGYIRINGWYSSWDDTRWDDEYVIVNPKRHPGFIYE